MRPDGTRVLQPAQRSAWRGIKPGRHARRVNAALRRDQLADQIAEQHRSRGPACRDCVFWRDGKPAYEPCSIHDEQAWHDREQAGLRATAST
jgi:hypothetical protein